MTDRQKNYIRACEIENRNRKRVLAVCPNATEECGIYMFHRVDENGECHAYVGKATHLIARLAQHLSGYVSHVDKSLRTHGLWAIDNPYGYHISILCKCEWSELDTKEREYIALANEIFTLKNVESGGTTGKTDINERKPSRGYRDGVAQGEKNVINKIAHLFDLHLKAVYKAEKPSKNAEKALQRFYKMIQGENKQ